MNMKRYLRISLFIGLILFSLNSSIIGGGFADDDDSVKIIIEKTINNSIGWAKNKDINLLYSIIVNDSSYIEVDPEDRVIKGFDEFKLGEKFWMNPDFKAIRHEIRNLQIKISKTGEVAWFYGLLDDINEWKGKPANWINTRWTGVLEKRADKWVIVQMHFSFAAK